MSDTKFYLGAHHPHWLRLAGVRLFVSRRALGRQRSFPRAIAPWALDSGGFTELSMHGRWTIDAHTYVGEVRRFKDEIGSLEFASPCDWMCEPDMLKRTGLTVEEHQRRTIDNYLELTALAPDLPWIPVLQGWSIGDYLRHLEDYDRAGVDLRSLPLVGVGTVCRRQNTITASLLMSRLYEEGIRIHAFGFKLTGLRACSAELASADSMAWSYSGRRNPPMPGHTHKNCANCLPYAMIWRESALAALQAEARCA